MALLNVPDLYAQKRGGWATDRTMKLVYQHATHSLFLSRTRACRTVMDDRSKSTQSQVSPVTSEERRLSHRASSTGIQAIDAYFYNLMEPAGGAGAGETPHIV